MSQLVHYTKLLSSHVRHGKHHHALALFSQIHARLPLDPFVFPLALNSCAALRLLRSVASVHALAVKAAAVSNPFVASALVDAYGKSSPPPASLVRARQLFDESPDKNVVVWNAMISLYSHSNDVSTALRLFESMDVAPNASTYNSIIAALSECEDGGSSSSRAVDFFRRMQSSGIRPNLITLLALLPSCVRVAALNLVKEIHGFGVRSCIHENPQLSSGLVESYGKCGGPRLARQVFDCMTDRDVVAWSSMVSVYAFNGEGEIAMQTFRQMDAANVRPDGIMFLAVLKACSHAGLADEALRYFELLTKDYSLQVGNDHYACLVDVLSRAGRLQEAYEVIRGMPMRATAKAWGALLGGCRSYGEVPLAEIAGRNLFEMEPENAGNFVILAYIYSNVGRFEEAEKVWEEMKARFVRRTPGSSWFTSPTPRS